VARRSAASIARNEADTFLWIFTMRGHAPPNYWAWSSLRSGTCTPQAGWNGSYNQSGPAWRYLSEVDTLFANRKVSGLSPFSLPRIIVSVLQRSTGLEGLNSCVPLDGSQAESRLRTGFSICVIVTK
jgi:hypothetical protein